MLDSFLSIWIRDTCKNLNPVSCHRSCHVYRTLIVAICDWGSSNLLGKDMVGTYQSYRTNLITTAAEEEKMPDYHRD